MTNDQQTRCAANGHEPYVIATRTIVVREEAFRTVKKRERFCTGCDMSNPSRRKEADRG